MIVAIYNDDYNNNFVATGEDFEAVMQQLEQDTGEVNISPQDLMVIVGEPVKVIKTVTYTIEKI